MRSKWRSVLAIAAALIIFDPASGAAGSDRLDAFLAAYQCSLAGLIAKILAHDKPEDQDRFITLSLPGPIASYVQCAFEHGDRDALCEASSGFWNNPWEKPHFSSIELRALAGLGFSTNGSRGNFRRQMHFPPGGPEPYELARLLLSALYEGYGANKDMRIEVVAPFALRHGFLPRRRCALISQSSDTKAGRSEQRVVWQTIFPTARPAPNKFDIDSGIVFVRCHLAQFSMTRPGISRKSASLFVTRIEPVLMA